MKVIAVVSRKGGTGKTTLSGHLAVQAELAGAGPVVLIDTDPQGSLSRWWNCRQADRPYFLRTTISTLSNDLAELRSAGIKLVFIDTPPAMTSSIVEIVKISDLVIIPVRPSPHDLAAIGMTIDLVVTLGKPMVYVVNGATARSRITGEAAIALAQHGAVAPIIVHNRTDFATSMIDGRTVMELSRTDRSAEEIQYLWEYFSTRLEQAPDMAQRSTGEVADSNYQQAEVPVG